MAIFDSISNFFLPSALTQVNGNFDTAETELTARLKKDGSVPMSGNLDMNSNRLLNLADGTSNTDAATVGQVKLIPKGDTGDRGPQGYTVANLADLKAAEVTDKALMYNGAVFTWETTNAPYTADDVDTIASDTVSTSVGAWVRQRAQSILADDGNTVQDNLDHGGSFEQSGTGAIVRTSQDKLREIVSVKDFGAVGDGVTDDTAAVQAAIDYAVTVLPATIKFPRGIYLMSSALTSLASNGLTLQGDGIFATTLKFTQSGEAIKIDAFSSGSPSDPFINVSLLDLTIQGNSNTTTIVWAQGISRSKWRVAAKEANTSTGIAFNLFGCMSNTLELMCSHNSMPMTNKPSEGLRLSAGTRAGSSVGNSSNNTLINPQFDNILIACRLAGADQNYIVGGSFQAAGTYGLLIASGSRYNSFIGTGFENPDATSASVADGGSYTKYLNCYAQGDVDIQSGSRSCRIEGGIFQHINIASGALKASVERLSVNNGTTGTGISDLGTASWVHGIYDINAAAFVQFKRSRTGITVGASPFTWTNDTNQYVDVVIQDGTLTQLLQKRGTDSWKLPFASPTRSLVPPGDSLVLSYSSAPTLVSYVPHTGLPG